LREAERKIGRPKCRWAWCEAVATKGGSRRGCVRSHGFTLGGAFDDEDADVVLGFGTHQGFE
jgi:hypothetical protein